jgi:rhodanese-related sulfurtransferase
MRKFMICLALFLPVSSPVFADETGWTPRETYERVQSRGERILFVDVRDPVEIMFVGFTDAVHVNIPFLIVDRNRWDEEHDRFVPELNPNFAAEIEAALRARGLDKDAEIVTMCRSGSERGKPSADYLRENGFPNAYFVIDGFQGGRIREGEHAGFRLKNGWQNSGLPWDMKMNPDKIYRTDRKTESPEQGG